MQKPDIISAWNVKGHLGGSSTYGAGLRIYWHDGEEMDPLNGTLAETVIRAAIERIEFEMESDPPGIEERTNAIICSLKSAVEDLDFLAMRREYYRKYQAENPEKK